MRGKDPQHNLRFRLLPVYCFSLYIPPRFFKRNPVIGMNSECSICYTPFDGRKHRRHQCSNCQHEACFTCHKTFLLGNSTEARCMNCNVAWSMVFLFRHFPASFVMDYRKSRRDMIWNRELYQLPTITEYVDQKNQEEAALQQQTRAKMEVMDLKNQYRLLKGKRGAEVTSARASIRQMKKQKEEEELKASRAKWTCSSAAHRIHRRFLNPRLEAGPQEVESTNSTYRNRPCIKEDCRGFVNSQGRCPICSTTVCMDCNLEVTEGQSHTCQQSDIDNWHAICKHSKPCPSCHVYIFKISGCNQMFCTNCSTPFDWVTGRIVTGPIHNPHYYEQLFDNARRERFQPIADPREDCDHRELMDARMLHRRLRQNETLSDSDRQNIMERQRILNHIRYVVLSRVNSITDERYRAYIFDALLDHLKGKTVAPRVEQFLNRRILNTEYSTLLETYINQQNQLLYAFCNQTVTFQEFVDQFDSFKSVMQDTLKDYNKMFRKSMQIRL